MSVEQLEEGLLRSGLPFAEERRAGGGRRSGGRPNDGAGGHMTIDATTERHPGIEMTGDPRFRGGSGGSRSPAAWRSA